MNAPAPPIKILLVDDEEDAYLLLQNMLEAGGGAAHKVEWISQYKPAVEALTQNRHDVYIVDYRLDNHDGMALIAEARRKGGRGPFILMTGYNRPGLDLQALAAGFDDYLVKGEYTADELKRAIRYCRERARNARHLRQSEQKFRALAETTPNALFVADDQGRLLYANPSALALFGHAAQDLPGLTLADLVAERSREAHRQAWERLRGEGEGREPGGRMEMRGVKKDGAEFPIEMSLTTWETDEGRFFAAIIRDTSALKAAAEALQRMNAELERRVRQRTAELRESQQRYQAFIRQSTEGIWRFELEKPLPVDCPEEEQIEHAFRHAYLAECNDAMARMYGFSGAEDLAGKRLEDFLIRSDPKNTDFLRTFVRSGYRLTEAESHEKDRDGNDKYFLNNFIGVVENGQLVRVWGTQRDITERKRIERELQRLNEGLEQRVNERTVQLREKEARFRCIAESAMDGVLLADETGRLLYGNRSAARLFGCSEQDFREKDVFQLLDGPSRREAEAFFRHPAAEEARFPARPLELQGVDKQGRVFPLEMSLASWQAEERRFFSLIVRDITERRRAESHLRFQADILSQVNDAVIVTDRDGRIVYGNRRAEELYGVETGEMIGHAPDELVRGAWLPPALEASLRDELAAEGSWRAEVLQTRRNGEEMPVDLSVSAIKDESGAVAGRVILVRDVTERRRLEGMLLHSEKLAAMGQMAAAVSHELKAPLAVIFGFADALSERLRQDKASSAPLDIIKRQAMRCANLINNLLDFSRKGEPAEMKEFALQEAVEAALVLVRSHVAEHLIHFRSEIHPEPLVVRAHRDMIEQIVINLALNGIDAMKEKGVLTVGVEPLSRGGRAWARIRVQDTGVGIPKDAQKRLFEPFFTTKEAGKGTGLGLWLVRQIVSRLEGTIECESAPKKGTVFTVCLPLAGKRPSAGTAAPGRAVERPARKGGVPSKKT